MLRSRPCSANVPRSNWSSCAMPLCGHDLACRQSPRIGVTLSSLSTSPLSAVVGAALTRYVLAASAAKYNVAPACFTQSDATTAGLRSTCCPRSPRIRHLLGISFALKYTLNKGNEQDCVGQGVVSRSIRRQLPLHLTLVSGATLTVTDWIDGGTQDNDMGA